MAAYELGGVARRTLLVRGELDAVVGREEIHRLRDTLRAARLIELSGVGHCPQNEAPERCGAAFDELCAELG